MAGVWGVLGVMRGVVRVVVRVVVRGVGGVLAEQGVAAQRGDAERGAVLGVVMGVGVDDRGTAGLVGLVGVGVRVVLR